jgi:sulfur carrier protein
MTRVIIDLNGSQCELAAGSTLLSLIETTAGTARGSAVVVDGAVVPRSAWPDYRMRDGQRIELIRAVQGG